MRDITSLTFATGNALKRSTKAASTLCGRGTIRKPIVMFQNLPTHLYRQHPYARVSAPITATLSGSSRDRGRKGGVRLLAPRVALEVDRCIVIRKGRQLRKP